MPQEHSTQNQIPFKRIRWEEDEAFLLADACMQVHKNPALRKSLISTTSALLRRRAELLGMHPSDKFRNENGIGMQMIALERAMYGDTRMTWHTSALFREVAKLFREQREQFYQKLQKAKDRWVNSSPTAETFDA